MPTTPGLYSSISHLRMMKFSKITLVVGKSKKFKKLCNKFSKLRVTKARQSSTWIMLTCTWWKKWEVPTPTSKWKTNSRNHSQKWQIGCKSSSSVVLTLHQLKSRVRTWKCFPARYFSHFLNSLTSNFFGNTNSTSTASIKIQISDLMLWQI